MTTSARRTRKRLPSSPPLPYTAFNEWQLPSSTTAGMATPPEPRSEDMLFMEWQLPTPAAAETATTSKSSSDGLSGDTVDTEMTTPPKHALQDELRHTPATEMTILTRGGTLLSPLSQYLFGDILDTEMRAPARTKAPLSPSSQHLVEHTLGVESAMSPRPSIETETPLSPSSQALPGDTLDIETPISAKPAPQAGVFYQPFSTEMAPENHSSRAGTPLSPLSEELFGDILDAELTRFAYPGYKYWSESEGEDTHRTKKPRITSYDPAATPNLLFQDELQRTTDPSASATRLQSIKVRDNAPSSISFSTTVTLPHPIALPNVGAPPIVRPQPVFCHLIQSSMGQAAGADYGQGTIASIRQFKDQIFGDCVASPSENIFEALSQAHHFFEIRVELTLEEVTTTTGNEDKDKEKPNVRHVELSRYFVPSTLEENKYIEAHPKDVAAGLNPSRGRTGGMENLVPRVRYTCTCVQPPNAFHALQRTVFLLKNYSFRGAAFPKRLPTALPPEWLLSGPGKEWGLTLDQVKEKWKAAAPQKVIPDPETSDEEMYNSDPDV